MLWGSVLDLNPTVQVYRRGSNSDRHFITNIRSQKDSDLRDIHFIPIINIIFTKFYFIVFTLLDFVVRSGSVFYSFTPREEGIGGACVSRDSIVPHHQNSCRFKFSTEPVDDRYTAECPKT